MIEKIAVRIFLVSLISCASLVLSFMWGGPPAEEYFQIAATLFIVGLVSFLIWLVTILYRTCDSLTKRTESLVL